MTIKNNLLADGTLVRGTRDSYTVLKLIGRGGMGTVYRVQRASDNTIWALKEMRPQVELPPEELVENRRLFEQEAELLRTLSFPNLPVIVDLFTNDQRPTLVMEFVPGDTLEHVIHEANAPLLKAQVISYGIQLCRVLHYLHSRTPPIIYRDLKPSNVILTPDGVLKLIDFGVARKHKSGQSKDTIAMGSAGYAPPEQYGKEQTDARSDIYALGATLLHLATNLPPVPLQTPQPNYVQKLNRSIDTRTEQVIIKAMSIKRDQRFQTCAEMEQALHACLDTPFVDPTQRSAPPPAVPVQPAPPPVVASTPPPPPPLRQEPAEVGVACARCGRVNKQGARFCAGCGAPLKEPPIPRLLVQSPYRSWELKLERLPFRIGRRDPRQSHYPELDLAEHDRGIASRHHATIQRDGDYYTVTDLGSTNGTLLNGVLLPARVPQRLRQGDRVKVGEVEMEFRWS
jgi:serine/threonine protein kinase